MSNKLMFDLLMSLLHSQDILVCLMGFSYEVNFPTMDF